MAVAASMHVGTAAAAAGPTANEAETQDEAHHQKHDHDEEEDLGGLSHVAPHLPSLPSTTDQHRLSFSSTE